MSLVVATACGEDGPARTCQDLTGHCGSAHLEFQQGGSSFDFMGPAVQTVESARWVVRAQDPEHLPYALAITWAKDQVSGPSTHLPNTISGAVEFYVTRPHPTDAGMIRTSNTREGTLTFTRLGYNKGDVIAGTFHGLKLVRDTSDDKVQLAITGGAFSAVVP